MTENGNPVPDPNRDRSVPLWPALPVVPAPVAGPDRTRPRPWARRLAAGAAAVVLSLGGAAVLGAAAVRLETDTVAVADLVPGAATGGRSDR